MRHPIQLIDHKERAWEERKKKETLFLLQLRKVKGNNKIEHNAMVARDAKCSGALLSVSHIHPHACNFAAKYKLFVVTQSEKKK